MEKQKKTQWHPAFCSAMRLEFKEYAEYLEYINEYNLTRKPLQIDLLIIKKPDDVFIDNELGRIMKKHNIIEYKSPDDSMNEDVFLKVISYACLYKSGEAHVGEIETEDISLTLIRKGYPRKLMQWLEKNGIKVYEKSKGIYYVDGVLGFSIQIVATGLLPKESQSWITLLNGRLSKEEAKRAISQTNLLQSKQEKEYADSILQVVVSDNQEIFDVIKKEEEEMCEALRQLMAPEIEEAVQTAVQEATQVATQAGQEKGRQEGRQEGRKEGRKEGENDFAQLVSALLQDNRMDLLERVTKDEELRKECYAKYGIRQ